MAPKNKSHKKTKAVEVTQKPSSSFPTSGPIATILNSVVKAGFSSTEVEAAFDKLWSEGLDVDNVNESVASMISYLNSKKENGDNKKKDDKKDEVPAEDTSSLSLEKTLQQVISLPNISDVLEGLVRWYNSATPEEREVLVGGTIIHDLLLRMLQLKGTIPSAELASFFSSILLIPSDVSFLLADAFISMHTHLPNLPTSETESLQIFERVMRNIGASEGTKKGSVIRLANLYSMIEETKKEASTIEGNEPKQQFMRRDLQYKSVKLGYEAISILSDVSDEDINSVEAVPQIELKDYFTVPENAEKAKEESEKLQKQIDTIQEECSTSLVPCKAEVKSLQTSVDELTAKRDTLRKELEAVERQLTSQVNLLQLAEEKVKVNEQRYHKQLDSLKERCDKSAKIASTAVACTDVMKTLNAAQSKSTEIIQSLHESRDKSNDKSIIFEETKQYVIDEGNCIAFLEQRAHQNTVEADTLAKALQTQGHNEEKLQRILKLRRLVANDLDTTSALRRFAQEIENACSHIVTKEIMEANRKVLVCIYVNFHKLHVQRTLSEDAYNVIKDQMISILPKPDPMPRKMQYTEGETKKVGKDEKSETKKVEKTKKEEKPVVKSGKKWATIKKQEVKGVDEIRKEMELAKK